MVYHAFLPLKAVERNYEIVITHAYQALFSFYEYKLVGDFWGPHDDAKIWKYPPRYRPFVRGLNPDPVNAPHKGQWRGALMFSLICVWINGWINNREAGDLRRYCAHYDVTVMFYSPLTLLPFWSAPIPAWISNYIDKVWDEITYAFPNFNGATVEVWECISNFIPHFTGHVITYSCWD